MQHDEIVYVYSSETMLFAVLNYVWFLKSRSEIEVREIDREKKVTLIGFR